MARGSDNVPPDRNDDPAELRRRAARARSYASTMSDIETAERLRQFANELEAQAKAKEARSSD